MAEQGTSFDALPEYRPDEMIPLPSERVTAECDGEVGRAFATHGADIRGIPREVAERSGFIPDVQRQAHRRGWTVCRRRERYLLIAVPSRTPSY